MLGFQQCLRGFVVICFVVELTGCNRDEGIVSYQAPKDQPKTQSAQTADGGGDSGARWSAPAGWKELPAQGMRVAAFEAPDDPSMQLTVVPLGPGLPLLANVNRWEKQIGLPP